jgi:hypothetical protein
MSYDSQGSFPLAQTTVELQLEDVLGRPLTDPHVLLEFFSTADSRQFRASVQPNGEKTVSVNLPDPGNSFYRVTITPSNYRIIQFFLLITDGQRVTRSPVVFPVDPGRVVAISAPAFPQLPQSLQSFLDNASVNNAAGLALYEALPPLRQAALLNLFTKSTAITLGDGTVVFSKLGSMLELDQDRLFAKVGADLLEMAEADSFFHSADFSLHRDIPPYQVFTSFKTPDPRGNLQLTFSRNGAVGNDYLVDMDIDLSQGFGHIFEVLDNKLTASLTNPYDVREVLIAQQHLRPPYDFVFAAAGAATVAMAAG